MNVSADGIVEVKLADIRRGNNHREVFDQAELEQLAQTIHASGLIQPVILRPVEPAGYEIVAGERRTIAHRIITEKVESGTWEPSPYVRPGYVRAIIRSLTDDEVEELMLLENIQRVNLNPMEESNAYARQLKRGWTMTRLVERTGKEAGHIRKMLLLQSLVPEAKDLLLKGSLEFRHAILMVDPDYLHQPLDENRQRMVLQLLARVPGMSMRNFKQYVQDLLSAQLAQAQQVMEFWMQLNVEELAEDFIPWGPKAKYPFEVRTDIPRPLYVQNDTTGDVIYNYIEALQRQGFEAEAGVVSTLYERLVRWHFVKLPKPSALR